MNKLQIIILAGGEGKRMGNPNIPKALTLIKDKPMISYLLDSVNNSKICDKPIIVVGKMANQIKQAFGDKYTYVMQEQQLGTGHAVLVTQDVVNMVDDVMVLYGDHPLITSQLIKNLANDHLNSNSVLTMATFITPDFNSWRSEFKRFGKVIRDKEGLVNKITEVKDATEDELKIMELSPSYFCFKADWLWKNINNLNNDNAQGEYYLTDLIAMAVSQGHGINTISIDPKEALGINTPEQLEVIKELL